MPRVAMTEHLNRDFKKRHVNLGQMVYNWKIYVEKNEWRTCIGDAG